MRNSVCTYGVLCIYANFRIFFRRFITYHIIYISILFIIIYIVYIHFDRTYCNVFCVAVKALNQARLEANVRAYGETKFRKRWPSPYAIACGTLLLLSLLKYVYHPLRWLAIGAVAAGIYPITLRGITALRNFTLDINILILIAGK